MRRQSAIKVMGRGMSHDPEAISRFNREASNASRINHPNVCAVYDFGETEDGTIYLAMEFVEGRTLSSLLKETGPLSIPRAAALLQQCADGLQAAHELGIVHRDLKPDNIMIVAQKGRETVKVVDFGIAKAAGAEPGQNVTKTGLVVGTPEYMSPEQLSGDKVDGRSDIYSLALVFYRMITDTLPFLADTAQETMIKRLTDEPIPLAQARPDVTFPPALQPVMDKGLARWPQDRYATATEFAAEVNRVASGAKSTAAFTSADTEAKTQVVRPSGVKAAATAAVPPTRISEKKPGARVSPVMIGVGVVVLALVGGGLAMKSAFFGTKHNAAQSDTTRMPSAHDTNTTLLSKNDSSKTADTSSNHRPANSTLPNPNPGSDTHAQRNPPKADTPATTTHVPDAASLQSQVSAFFDDPEFVDDPGKRRAASRLGQDVYGMTELSSALRAQAAMIVGQVLLKEATTDESKREQARTWVQRAVNLDPKPSYRNLLDQI
jgi:serine/threonine protein kinase